METYNYLNYPLFEWQSGDWFTANDATLGIFASGSIGSGKTSGFGHKIAKHYLLNNFGFLILTAKESEKRLWQARCKKYGREKDLVIFSPDSGHSYNFFDEEINRQDSGKGIAYNIADVIYNVIKSGKNDQQESDKAFWENTLKDLLKYSIDLAILTKNTKFEHIYKIVQSAPRNERQLTSEQWQKSSECYQLMQHVAQYLTNLDKTPENEKLAKRLRNIEDFFLESWIYLSEKTRSIVETMFFGMASRFINYPLNDLFSNKTTIRPEDTCKGKIIIIDLPVMLYDEIGRDCQNLWKYLWQRMMRRRTIKNNSRPVCLWVDEFQEFINPEKDVQFQAIAREYRACSVFITQNLPVFYLNAGQGEIGKTRFKALAGNLGTKFFLANSDVETNEYASNLIGKEYRWSKSSGKTFGEKTSTNTGQSESLQYIVEPSEFTKLKTGGPLNNFTVQAFVHRQGKIFKPTQDNYCLFNLKQEPL